MEEVNLKIILLREKYSKETNYNNVFFIFLFLI
jgi:hypothetical protein